MNNDVSTGTGVPEIMTIEEAAAYLKVCPATVRRMIRENRIPFFRIRKNIRIFKAGLVESLSRPREEG